VFRREYLMLDLIYLGGGFVFFVLCYLLARFFERI